MIVKTNRFGVLIEGSTGESICGEIGVAEVASLLRKHGLVLFRGFAMDNAMFTSVTQMFSDTFRTHGAPRRSAVGQDEYLISADPGKGEIHLHAELSYLPAPPELLWFCCVSPPACGGETTVCDGEALWSMFNADLKRLFGSRRLCYSLLYSQDMWRRYFQVSSVEQLKAKLDGMEAITYSVGPGERALCKFYASAVRKCRYGASEAFVNSLLHWCLDGMEEFVSFDDSTRIPRSTIVEIQDMAEQVTVPIIWRAGDVAMIDNSRVMHGRRAYRDSQRLLHVRMGQSLTA